MTDEEKKAIQVIKNQKENIDEALIAMEIPENYMGEDIEQEYLEWQKNADTILNLIEKQSKEIEELKDKIKNYKLEDEKIITQFGEIVEKKRWKDKIKAKIEELEKGNKNTFIRGEKILVLQSLLEKE